MRYERHKAAISRSSRLPAKSIDGQGVKLLGNIELPEEVVAVVNYGGDGIGLYRTEFQYMSRPSFPSEEELYDKYSDVVQVMAPKPVTIRTLDVNGDKSLTTENGIQELNPALGLRGIRYCLQRPEVFRTQLRAILRAAVHGNVRIMFPMIATVSEVIQAKRAIEEAAVSLEKDGVPFNADLKIGALIEVPSAVIMADVIAARGRFFQHRHQRSDPVHACHRSWQQECRPSLSAARSGHPAHAETAFGSRQTKRHPGVHLR